MVQALDNLTQPFFAGKTAIEVGNDGYRDGLADATLTEEMAAP